MSVWISPILDLNVEICYFFYRNPSSGSLVLSETGSLDRAKAAYERRKKNQSQDADSGTVSGRVETTRVNANRLIAELLKDTNLEQADDSAESKFKIYFTITINFFFKRCLFYWINTKMFWSGRSKKSFRWDVVCLDIWNTVYNLVIYDTAKYYHLCFDNFRSNKFKRYQKQFI